MTFLACTFCFPISDHVMPSWEFSFCFFINYAHICTCIRRNLKETILSGSITWSEMRKQNIQAKEVYWEFKAENQQMFMFITEAELKGEGRGTFFNSRQVNVSPTDLFSQHILLSQYRPHDILNGIFLFRNHNFCVPMHVQKITI